MINTEDFIKRLEIILEYYGISASVFADKIGVQRSGLSHLLSGRNKPSLDFVMRITENYPEVDLYWLLNGTGSFPKNDSTQDTSYTPTPTQTETSHETTVPDLFSSDEVLEIKIDEKAKQKESLTFESHKAIDRIVIFYKDGTFKSYNELP